MTHGSMVKHLKEINAERSTQQLQLQQFHSSPPPPLQLHRQSSQTNQTKGGGDAMSAEATTKVLLRRRIKDEIAMRSDDTAVGLDDFKILRVLGKGAYGKVYQVRKVSCGGNDLSGGKIFAMKSVNKSRIADSKTDMRHTRTERDVLVRVEHPFVIKLFYAFETTKRLYFVQEFCRGGELFRLMETERMFMEDQARFYLCEIACALEYLHKLNIVYRDLKTENIMLDAEGHIKLIDFGLSKVLDDGKTLTSTFCGTVEYMAPEVVIKSPGHGKPADWWSFGIFMYDLLTGQSPFHSNRGKKETKERILRGKFTIPPFISREAADLLRRLIRRNVDRRLGGIRGAPEVKSHPFFARVDWDRVLRREYPPPHVPEINNEDETDVSQFDPRFTSRTPRESDRQDQTEKNQKRDLTDSGCGSGADSGFDNMFGDFEYVSPECLGAMIQLDDEEEEDDLEVINSRVAQLELSMHMRSHGD